VGGHGPFSRWLTRDYLVLFPQVPERTRLARLFKTHTAWTARFLAAPTVLGVADSSGIELIPPMREGRSPAQIGKKGQSNHRWIVGGNLCCILNQWGLICAWDCATANVHDTHFHSHSAPFSGILKQFCQGLLKRAVTELSTDDVMRHNHLFL